MRTVILFFVLAILISCTKNDGVSPSSPSSVVQKGSRKFGLHVTYGSAETYNDAFNILVTNRYDHVNLHQIWGDGGISGVTGALATNAAGTSFDFTNIDIANAFYPAYGKGISLTIGTIDTNNKFVPSSFIATDFDQTSIRTAFKNLLSSMLPRLTSSDIIGLQIGNEVDIFLGTDATAWSKYKTFFDDISAYAKTLNPNLKIGVTTTLYGAISSTQKTFIQNLNSNADFVSVTYYPVNSDFTMKSSAVIESDIGSLVALYPTKPIYIQEFGYSSGSSYVASSEQKQNEAVQAFFLVWDKYASNIPFVSWLNLTEWSQASVDGYGSQYGMCPGVSCDSFKEFLKTLGLRDYTTGTYKPALTEIINQTTQRGW